MWSYLANAGVGTSKIRKCIQKMGDNVIEIVVKYILTLTLAFLMSGFLSTLCVISYDNEIWEEPNSLSLTTCVSVYLL